MKVPSQPCWDTWRCHGRVGRIRNRPPTAASTVSLQSESLAPAPAEDLVAYGRCTHRDGDMFWADVDITVASTSNLIGRGTVLYRIVTA